MHNPHESTEFRETDGLHDYDGRLRQPMRIAYGILFPFILLVVAGLIVGIAVSNGIAAASIPAIIAAYFVFSFGRLVFTGRPPRHLEILWNATWGQVLGHDSAGRKLRK